MIKVYYADIDALREASVFEQLYEKVKEQRRSKILRCKNKEDKYRSLAAGLLLRFALEQLGIDYENVSVSVDENGKPFLNGERRVPFSLSHSGNLAVCAVYMPEEEKFRYGVAGENIGNVGGASGEKVARETEGAIGIDIEKMERIVKICAATSRGEHILDKVASSKEKDWFLCLPEDKRNEGFLRIWTGKESYGKMNGKGIVQELRNVNVLDETNFLFVAINKEYYMTVCMENINKTKLELIPIDIAKEYLK